MARKRKAIDLAYDRTLAERGLTVPERAAIHRVDPTTLRRALERGETPPAPDRAPDAAPNPEPGDRAGRALAKLEHIIATGEGASVVAAARAVLDESRREKAVNEYTSAQHAQARAAVRLGARALGRAIKARIESENDEELAELYTRAASMQATAEDVEALADALMTPARRGVLDAVA